MITAIVKLVSLIGGGVLLATELPPILQALSEASQMLTTANDMDMVKTLAFQFQVEKGHYPQGEELSEVLRNGIGGRQDPDSDRWGTPFQIEGLPKYPYVLSCGPDTTCGNKDDLKLFIAAIPEGEKQLDFADLVQTNLLDKLKFFQGEATPAVEGNALGNEGSEDFAKALEELRAKAAAAEAEDDEDEPPPPPKKKHNRTKHTGTSSREE